MVIDNLDGNVLITEVTMTSYSMLLFHLALDFFSCRLCCCELIWLGLAEYGAYEGFYIMFVFTEIISDLYLPDLNVIFGLWISALPLHLHIVLVLGASNDLVDIVMLFIDSCI